MIALSLFAGVGFGVACEQLGITELGIESDADVIATRSAAGMPTISTDVWHLAGARTHLRYDILLAGPPCQTFSGVGRGEGRAQLDLLAELAHELGQGKTEAHLRARTASIADPRTALVLTPLVYALRDRPAAIALEQVPQVLPVWEAYAEVLRGVGYSVMTGVLSAEQYGVPQTRRRAVLLAHRDRPVAMPEPTHSRYHVRNPDRLDPGVLPWVSMADALGWPEGVVGFPRRYDGLDDGVQFGDVRYRSRDLRSTGRPSWAITGKARSWKRWGFTQRPAVTVHGHGLISRGPSGAKAAVIDGLESGAYIPRPPYTLDTARKPGVQRQDYLSITDRFHTDAVNFSIPEGAVLQTFPPDFPFQGSRTKAWQTVGNAVPPRLARAMIEALMTPNGLGLT